ncbi:hypothetical protein MKEN_00651100 [Mycena kentingensis (nom. inval.)]|nr:hypothetical protein MKEN_00651100 [Mycena kentingensis (nom. inval.)]
MRKASYALTALAAVFITILNILALTRVDWSVPRTHSFPFLTAPRVVATYKSGALNSTLEAKYGLKTVCTRLEINLPGGSRYEKPNCRAFPTRGDDYCDEENSTFCALWSSAEYATEVAIGFGALALVAIAVGVSTHSRRRRIWRAVAGLVAVQALLQVTAFAIVVDQYRMARYPTFEDALLGPGLWLTTVAWILGVLTTSATVVTGLAADRGKKWAAGRRAYEPILG